MPRPSYELDHVHPATANWLETNGYDYYHEKRLNGLIVDFYAWNANGNILLIECKPTTSNLKGAIRQLVRYRNQIDAPTRAALAFPKDVITPDVAQSCTDSNLETIALNIPSLVRVFADLPDPLYWTMRRVMIDDNIKRDGEMIRRILARDPGMRRMADQMGVNLDEFVVQTIGGYRREAKSE